MCIVIDLNVFGAVFNENNALHSEYSAVKNWINEKKGFLVIGGTGYKSELTTAARYMRLVRLMLDGGMVITIEDGAVNKLEIGIKTKTKGTKCNDQHIIALLAASQCPLLCSHDTRSFKFIKDTSLYPKKTPRVKIYTSSRNKNLLKKSDPSKLTNVIA